MKYEIKIWNNEELQRHIDRTLDPEDITERIPGLDYIPFEQRFEGFSLFTPKFFYNRSLGEEIYPDPSGLTEPEKQEKGEVSAEQYDRNIVALRKGEIIGISSFMWMKCHFSKWHYFQRFIETKEGKRFRKKGVAKALTRRLNEPCFLHGKIWRFTETDFEREGIKYLKHVYERDLDRSKFKMVSNWDFKERA